MFVFWEQVKFKDAPPLHTRTHVYTYTRRTHTHTRAHAHIHARIHTHTRTLTHTCTHIIIYTYARIYSHTHAYIHTCTYTQARTLTTHTQWLMRAHIHTYIYLWGISGNSGERHRFDFAVSFNVLEAEGCKLLLENRRWSIRWKQRYMKVRATACNVLLSTAGLNKKLFETK